MGSPQSHATHALARRRELALGVLQAQTVPLTKRAQNARAASSLFASLAKNRQSLFFFFAHCQPLPPSSMADLWERLPPRPPNPSPSGALARPRLRSTSRGRPGERIGRSEERFVGAQPDQQRWAEKVFDTLQKDVEQWIRHQPGFSSERCPFWSPFLDLHPIRPIHEGGFYNSIQAIRTQANLFERAQSTTTVSWSMSTRATMSKCSK